nr:Nuclear-interacting partner of ALK like [Ipomoea batatas]
MARSISQTLNLIRSNAKSSSSAVVDSIRLTSSRSVSSHPDSSVKNASGDASEAEAVAVQRIEDAIHRIIVRRSAPDWLPFVPGASYWVPPRRGSYGIADLVHKLSNSLSEEEVMALTTDRGWPSSSFFVDGIYISLLPKRYLLYVLASHASHLIR